MTGGFYSDLHCHILPFIDDGARSWEESLDMARASLASGAKRVFATPHYIYEGYTPTGEEILSAVQKLQQLVLDSGMDLDILPGSEVHISPSLARDFTSGVVRPLGYSKFVLVELPFFGLPVGTFDILFELKLRGAQVVIAHPERNSELRGSFKKCQQLIESGAYMQLNLGSLLGVYGRDVRSFAEKLVRRDFVHFIGTDGHRGMSSSRGCDARPGLRRLTKLSPAGKKILEIIEERVESLIVAPSP